jgi:hypothetical protein
MNAHCTIKRRGVLCSNLPSGVDPVTENCGEDCSLNLVLLGKDGLATALNRDIRVRKSFFFLNFVFLFIFKNVFMINFAAATF